MSSPRRGRLALHAVLAVLLGIPVVTVLAGELSPYDPASDQRGPAWDRRQDAFARAAVFMPDAPEDPGALDLTRPYDDAHPVFTGGPVDCVFEPAEASGTTPKFDCRLADGRTLKVKYGSTPERHAEVAATRLLRAAGFGADIVEFVPTLRCRGCPPAPFRLQQFADLYPLGSALPALVSPGRVSVYADVTVERNMRGRAVKAGRAEGWAFHELGRVDPSRGGATRADVDALRLMAVMLAHWDNKASNQRLVCLDDPDGPSDGPCRRPLIMLQDVGATFGPAKVEFDAWRDTPIWVDDTSCRVSMDSLPYNGATFESVDISEDGRRRLAARLSSLTRSQLTELFRSARFPEPWPGAGVTPWVDVFLNRVEAIAAHAPCPGVTG